MWSIEFLWDVKKKPQAATVQTTNELLLYRVLHNIYIYVLIELLVNTAVYNTYTRVDIIKKNPTTEAYIHLYIRMRTIYRPRANTAIVGTRRDRYGNRYKRNAFFGNNTVGGLLSRSRTPEYPFCFSRLL